MTPIKSALSIFAIAASLANPLLGQFVYVANQGSGNISGYSINATSGALTPVAGSPFFVNPPVITGLGTGASLASVAADPTGRFLYAANTVGGLLGYTINATSGALTAMAGSPFPGSEPIGIAVDPAGRFVYVADRTGSVLGFAINATTGALTPIAGAPPPAIFGLLSVAVDPTGKFVYAAINGGQVAGYTINTTTGALTPIGGSPFPAIIGLYSVAVDPTGKFVYASSEFGFLLGYTINATTGALSAVAGSPFNGFGAGLGSVGFDRAGKFAYVPSAAGSVLAYAINSASGALTAVAGSPFAAGQDPLFVAVDPTGKFAYVANYQSGSLSGYAINDTSGVLTAVPGTPFGPEGGPISVAITGGPAPFSAFTARLFILRWQFGLFDVSAGFTLGSPLDTINPVTQPVSLQIGTYSVTIPAGSFQALGKSSWYFLGKINGVDLGVLIDSLGNGKFVFSAAGAPVNFTGLTSPTTVMIAIGSDSGTASVKF